MNNTRHFLGPLALENSAWQFEDSQRERKIDYD